MTESFSFSKGGTISKRFHRTMWRLTRPCLSDVWSATTTIRFGYMEYLISLTNIDLWMILESVTCPSDHCITISYRGNRDMKNHSFLTLFWRKSLDHFCEIYEYFQSFRTLPSKKRKNVILSRQMYHGSKQKLAMSRMIILKVILWMFSLEPSIH